MKKRQLVFFLFILIFSSFFTGLHADESDSGRITWLSDQKPVISGTWAYTAPFRRDLRTTSPAEEFIAALDMRELRADWGIKYQTSQLDIASHIFYMPTISNICQFGLGLNYHFYRYFGEFTENDFIVTLRFRWIKGPVFSFENGVGYLFKTATIDAIKEYKSRINNLSYNYDLICRWQFVPAFGLWCGLQLQDFFDYPLAISPIYKFGLDLKCNPTITLGSDLSLKYADMFFSAVYLNEAVLRFTCKVAI